jgi:transcriptional regulator with XRE-family HTH domain
MPDQGSPTVRGRRLAAELRRLRERSGLTGEEVAARLGWSGSKVSRIELHRIGIKQPDLRKLLDLYGVGEPHRSELQALARESSQKSWLEKVTASFPPEQANYLQVEAEARCAWTWEPLVVPGLLQTAEYAEAVMQGWQSMFALPPMETERRVRARLIRQQLLTKEPPLELMVVIDESVLHRKFGDNTVMREQLNHLIELSQLPSIRVRVLPLAANHLIGCGAFYGLQFPQVHDVPLHDTVAVEHLLGTYYIEDEEDTYRFRVTFDRLMAESLSAGESRGLIARAAREIWA